MRIRVITDKKVSDRDPKETRWWRRYISTFESGTHDPSTFPLFSAGSHLQAGRAERFNIENDHAKSGD
jgi:hypothetical protein